MKKHQSIKPLKDALVSARISTPLKKRLREVEDFTRVTSSVILEEALKAICNYVEQNGEIRMPFEMVPVREMELLFAQRKSSAKPKRSKAA